jgi:hypothetical protein
MSVAWHFRGLKHQLTEASLLFRHQACAAEDAFGEACHYWPDQHGRRVARDIFEPKVQLMHPTSQALIAQVRLIEAAEIRGEGVEQAIATVSGATQDVAVEAQAATRLSLSAEQMAGQAYGRSHALEVEANRIRAALAVFGATLRVVFGGCEFDDWSDLVCGLEWASRFLCLNKLSVAIRGALHDQPPDIAASSSNRQ